MKALVSLLKLTNRKKKKCTSHYCNLIWYFKNNLFQTYFFQNFKFSKRKKNKTKKTFFLSWYTISLEFVPITQSNNLCLISFCYGIKQSNNLCLISFSSGIKQSNNLCLISFCYGIQQMSYVYFRCNFCVVLFQILPK